MGQLGIVREHAHSSLLSLQTRFTVESCRQRVCNMNNKLRNMKSGDLLLAGIIYKMVVDQYLVLSYTHE